MAKRRRAQERAKHGGELADHRPPEPVADTYGQVREKDRHSLEVSVGWLFKYLETLYEHGEGSSSLRDPYSTEWVSWHNFEARRLPAVASVKATSRRYMNYD
ncbi:hypothetical protein KC959_03555, partial [Candidatus Saccharibacteria bacterium]|nr:hypothetical protein [Candidatus Saccharibacteria bacterium]